MTSAGLASVGGTQSGSAYVPRPELEEALRTAISTGAGALVHGDAGVGKSRLVDAVLGQQNVVRTSCARTRFPSAQEVLAHLLAQIEPTPTPLLGLLRGEAVVAGPDQVEGRVVAAGRRLAVAAPGHVLVVDDAERLAPRELDLLALAIRASGCAWVLVSREESEGLGLLDIPVGAMSVSQARSLASLLLPGALEAALERLTRRTGGIPLALEHYAAVVDAGEQVDATSAPTSMREFVRGRLALLPAAEQDVLGIAAVLGDEPDHDLLQHLAGDEGSLRDALVARGLLRWTGDPALGSRLAFSHGVVRDVAAERLSGERRIEIHRAAAEWYAVLPVSQVLESQAYHLEQAVAVPGADCELVRRAAAAMVIFARSIEEERPHVAVEVVRRVRDLVDRRPECGIETLQLELCHGAVSVHLLRRDDAVQFGRRALELADVAGDTRCRAEANLHIGTALGPTDVDAALSHLQAAEAAYREVEDIGGVARVEVVRGFAAQREGGTAQQLASFERAYSLAVRSGDTRLQARSAQELALHHALATGRSAYAQWAERARDVGRSDDVGLEPRLELARAVLAMLELAPELGMEATTVALERAEELGIGFVQQNALMTGADLCVVAGDLDGAGRFLSAARTFVAERPSTWWSSQFDLVEARVQQRRGDVARALALLDAVASGDDARHAVMRRDLAEARAWVALERGHFDEARAQAMQALAVDDETGEKCVPLRPRLVALIANVVSQRPLPLGDVAALKALARETGLTTITEIANRFVYVDELTHGWSVDLYGLDGADTVEVRALDLEIEALSSRRFDLLVEASDIWRELGVTVWPARALAWHSELTGAPHPEVAELLTTLQSPPGLEEMFRAQVRGLHS